MFSHFFVIDPVTVIKQFYKKQYYAENSICSLADLHAYDAG